MISVLLQRTQGEVWEGAQSSHTAALWGQHFSLRAHRLLSPGRPIQSCCPVFTWRGWLAYWPLWLNLISSPLVQSSQEVWTWTSLSCVQLFVTPWTTVHGILQARILEWVAVPFFRGSSNAGNPHWRQILYQLSHQGSTHFTYKWAVKRRTKESLDEGERGEWNSWLKTQHSEN